MFASPGYAGLSTPQVVTDPKDAPYELVLRRKWTTTPPSVSGWYWYLFGPEDDAPECVQVKWCQRGQSLVLVRGEEEWLLAANPDTEALWCGPIPPPPLPTK